jgi:hypothetical protein
MDIIEDKQIEVPEISDNEWVDRFVNGYRQSFDKALLEDADVAIARIFAKYNHAKAV